MAAPSMTFNAAGNVRASATLASSVWVSYSRDYSTKIEGQVTIKNTPGGTVSATRGLRCLFAPQYGSTPTDTTLPAITYDFPSGAASTAESKTFYLGTGKWGIFLYNLDASNAITVEITDATVDGIA